MVRQVNDSNGMGGIFSGSGNVTQEHQGKGQAPSEMKNRNTTDHVDQMMHETVKPVQKWDKMDTACIQDNAAHGKSITSSITRSTVFDLLAPLSLILHLPP